MQVIIELLRKLSFGIK